MPGRKQPLLAGHIYHIFNKSLDHRKIFRHDIYCDLFLKLLLYYRSTKSVISYSLLPTLHPTIHTKIIRSLYHEKYFKAEILCYSLMPNHFHLLLRQKTKNGIAKYLSDVLNSFTRVHNLKNNRKGPLFLPRFKSVLIASDEQLIHTSRYIHLNHYSKGIVKTMDELELYPWTSYGEYLGKRTNALCQTKIIMREFGYDSERYRSFIADQSDYQKKLEIIKSQKDNLR